MKMLFLVVLFVCSNLTAKDFGQFGDVYEIQETDLLTDIEQKIKNKQASGELKQRHHQWRDEIQSRADEPLGAALPQATQYRSFAIDPTYTVPDDIRDHQGALVYPKGYSFNPLRVKPLTQDLYFIDASVAPQLEWLQKHCPESHSCRRILINGSVAHARKVLQERVYFDQGGVLRQFFRLEALPAVVRQSGEQLHVEEFAL